jgi:hypothetical protein
MFPIIYCYFSYVSFHIYKPLTAYGENTVNGQLVLLRVVVELGHAQDLKLPLHLMAVLNVQAQPQSLDLAIPMHVQVVKYLKLCKN